MAIISEEDGVVGILRGTRDNPPSDYLFKVRSFSLFSKHGVEKIESNKFEAGGHQWRIVLFPGGCNEGYGNHLSIYLSVASKTDVADGKEVNAIFRFFLFDQTRGKYLYVQGSARRFDRVKYQWGFSKFISVQDFKEPSNGYLLKDTCFIGAEVYVICTNLGLRECLSISDISDVPNKYKWTVTQFSKLWNVCKSDEFVVGGYKWKLVLYPEGNVKNKGCCLSIYMLCVDSQYFSPSQKVKAKLTFTLKDQIGQDDVLVGDTVWFSSSVKCWGCGSFIELKKLKDEDNGYIFEDQCIFEAEVSALYETCQKTLASLI